MNFISNQVFLKQNSIRKSLEMNWGSTKGDSFMKNFFNTQTQKKEEKGPKRSVWHCDDKTCEGKCCGIETQLGCALRLLKIFFNNSHLFLKPQK